MIAGRVEAWNTGNSNQQVLGYEAEDGDALFVYEIFLTIQGEGPFVGRPATFVRLAGCNLACHFCDTKYRLEERHRTTAANVVKRVQQIGVELVVVTGGEPFRQGAVIPLLRELSAAGLTVQVETSGSMWPKGVKVLPHRVHVVCSPKAAKVHPGIQNIRPMWKYLIDDCMVIEPDGLPQGLARQQLGEMHTGLSPKSIWLQGIEEVGDVRATRRNSRLAADLCMVHGFNLSVQIHKIVGLP